MWRRLALDAALWFLAPAVFLAIYVERFLAPLSSVFAHVRLIAMPLVALVGLRLLLARFAAPRLARVIVTAIVAALLNVMIAYYALVLVGLHSWGRVVSWDLLASYARQATQFADALGISVPLFAVSAVLAYFALFAAAWAYFSRKDWPSVFVARLPPRQAIIVALGAWAVCAVELYAFTHGAPSVTGEPIALTFHPEEQDIQGHAVDRQRAAMLDAAEDRVRAAYIPQAEGRRRNVVLIVVDALRPDHMGIYGYERNTTPYLQRLEETGVVQKARGMRAACASSACGILSLSTSRFLHQFSSRPFSLHESLRRHGYRVHLVLSGDHTLFYGLKDAYGPVDSYFDAANARVEHGGRYMNDDQLVLDRVNALPSWDGEPVLFHFHLMSAHVLSKRDPGLSPYAPASSYALSASRAAGRPEPTSVNFYDNGVLHADATIAALLALLERKGYLGDALVAVTADHGEALGEHGYLQHANSVREEVLRVPFVLIGFGATPPKPFEERVAASQVDIAPTLLAELGLPRPASWHGVPLQEKGSHNFLHFQERWEIGLYDLRDADSLWKYWRDNRNGEEYAFDLAQDPAEQVNLIEHAPAHLAREWRRQVLATGPVGSRRRDDDALLDHGYPIRLPSAH